MLNVIKSGGLLEIPIIICGVIATFIIIERFIYYAQLKKKDVELYDRIIPLIKKQEYKTALKICKSTDTPSGQVCAKALSYREFDAEDIKDAVATEINRQVPQLEKFLTTLGTIANISTLLGLLGTVTGNIGAFGVLGAGGSMGNPAVLAGSIAEALVTTASGLVVSIPAVIFHNVFVSKANRITLEIDSSVSDIVLRLTSDRDRED